MSRRAATVGFVLAALLPGCLYVGGKGAQGPLLSAEQVAALSVGRATEADVLALLGPPDEYRRPEQLAGLADDRLRLDGALDVARRAERVWTWQRQRFDLDGTVLLLYNHAGIDIETDVIVVVFDADGVVRELAWRLDGVEGGR